MIVPVTYYKVRCDWPECKTETGDMGSEYSAWGDSGGAIDDWVNGDGIVLEGSGRALCAEHAPVFMCSECGEEAYGMRGIAPNVTPTWKDGNGLRHGHPSGPGRFVCPTCHDELEASK